MLGAKSHLLEVLPLIQSLAMQRRRALRPSRCWVLALALATAAEADETADETLRWVPSFALYFDALGQKASGSIASGNVEGPPVNGGTDCNGARPGRLCTDSSPKLRPDASSRDTDVAPLVGGSLELMTPRLFDAVLRPRLFVHGDASASFGFERNLAGEGSPGPFLPPQPRAADTDVVEVTVLGQGSRAKAQVKRWVYSAGGGIAFSIDLLGRRFRIKPSFEYLHQELDLIGSLRRAVKQQPTVQPGTLEGYRFVVLAASKEKALDAIGPGLEIEADTLRAGPFLLSIYASTRGYHFLGSLEDTLTATNEFGETATWSFDRERWAWRAGAGLRFRLVPE